MQSDLFELSDSRTVTPPAKVAFLDRARISVRMDHALVMLISLVMIYAFIFSFGVEKGKRFAMAELRSERAKRERISEELTQKIFEIQRTNQPAPPTQPAQPVQHVQPVQASAATIAIHEQAEKAKPFAAAIGFFERIKKNFQPKEVSAQKSAAAVVSVVTMKANENEKPSSAPAATPDNRASNAPQYTIQLVTFGSRAAAEAEVKKLEVQGHQGFIVPSSSGKFMQICINTYSSREQAAHVMKDLKLKNIIPSDAYVRLAPQNSI